VWTGEVEGTLQPPELHRRLKSALRVAGTRREKGYMGTTSNVKVLTVDLVMIGQRELPPNGWWKMERELRSSILTAVGVEKGMSIPPELEGSVIRNEVLYLVRGSGVLTGEGRRHRVLVVGRCNREIPLGRFRQHYRACERCREYEYREGVLHCRMGHEFISKQEHKDGHGEWCPECGNDAHSYGAETCWEEKCRTAKRVVL
jgi:hypothetical protein